jgi:hypothetical protein
MPCYITTYSLTGPCGVNVNSVIDTEDQPQGDLPTGRCLLYFQDGSQLLLDESCEIYALKASNCSDTPPDDLPIYG